MDAVVAAADGDVAAVDGDVAVEEPAACTWSGDRHQSPPPDTVAGCEDLGGAESVVCQSTRRTAHQAERTRVSCV